VSRGALLDGALRRGWRVRWLKKPVDEKRNVLHNLVSLLLMQRRRTKAVMEVNHGLGD
jgi:hypothetical protein